MADIQELYLVENAMRPGTDIFQQCLDLLLTEPGSSTSKKPFDSARTDRHDWVVTLPVRGDYGGMEEFVRRYGSFKFSDKGAYHNGISSLGVAVANILDIINMGSRARRMTRSACFTNLHDVVSYVTASSENCPYDIFDGASMFDAFTVAPYETAVMDHTTVNVPVDKWLNLCYHRGVRIVEGCFYYHPAVERGWDTKFSWTGIQILHSSGEINIGPADDASRQLTYTTNEYRSFVDPDVWVGNASKYIYEIFNLDDGVATYRAVYVGVVSPERISFNVPMCSDKEKILITLNSEYVCGTFTPVGKYFDQMVDLDHRNYAMEVDRATFDACVSYLVTLSPNADIIGASIRYIASRNYIDLVDGAKLVRKPGLNYSDALILALVCALTSFHLRYELTSESVSIIRKAVNVAKYSNPETVMGLFGTIVVGVQNLVKQRISGLYDRAVNSVKAKLSSATHIPGILFDVYLEKEYTVGNVYHQVAEIVPELAIVDDLNPAGEVAGDDDPFVSFIGGDVKASAPELRAEDLNELSYPTSIFPRASVEEYIPMHIDDPVVALQDVYDTVLPGQSTLDIPNVSEQKRVRDININTEFVGKVCINKDAVVSENLYHQPPLRTGAVPQTKTSLADLMMASSKRNWNKPDLQLVTDVYELAEKFVSEFITEAMIPGAADILAAKEADPTRFNTLDYCDWMATRSGTFREALLASCPNEILELNLEKYQTILKGRVKQKMSVAAHHELPQGQVVIHHDASTNALFTSVFRNAFNTLDTLLKPTFKSAGRISDTEFSLWLTSIRPYIEGSVLIEIDSGKYDKSQGMLAQAIEIVLLRRLGVAPEILESFKDSYVGSVNSRNLGLAFIIAFQRKSGGADTMLGNIIYNYVSAGRSIGYKEIKFCCGKGDDNIVGVNKGYDDLISQRMSYIFNLDAKVIRDKVPSFSSGYIVPLEDCIVFAPDPIKKVMLLGEINARGSDHDFNLTLDEKRDRFQSFRDAVSVYTVPGLVPILQAEVRQRMDVPEADIHLCVDALIALAKDFDAYCKAVPF